MAETFVTRYTSSEKKDLVESINHLDAHAQEDVFMILKSHGVFFSQNCNGIFINMKNVPDEVIAEIMMYINTAKERAQWLTSTGDIEHISSHFPVPDVNIVRSTSMSSSSTMVNNATVKAFVNNLESQSGHVNCTKTYYGKFQTAKKKFGRPVNRNEDQYSMGLAKQDYLVGEEKK